MIYQRIAVPTEGDVVGETIFTKASETSDDSESESPGEIDGKGIPFLATLAVPANGVLEGETILTRSGGETSDDEPLWG